MTAQSAPKAGRPQGGWKDHAKWLTWMNHDAGHYGRFEDCDSPWCGTFTPRDRLQFALKRRLSREGLTHAV